MGHKIYLDRNWMFTENYSDDMLTNLIQGEEVTIPHTCKETPFHYFDESSYQMISCYQKELVIDNSMQGKVLLLTFEGVGHKSDVYLNGKHLVEHKCGYTAFTIDITNEVSYGEKNLLVVKVDSNETVDQPPFGFVIDYMTYGGIYRDVYLEVKNPAYIEDVFLQPGFVTTPDTTGMDAAEIAKVQTTGTLKSEIILSKETVNLAKEKQMTIRQTVNGQLVASEKIVGSEETIVLETTVDEVSLWDVESPVLYTVKTELILEGSIEDTIDTKTGFRHAIFTKDGFYLNGRKFKIRGLNRHQSYPYVGYAMPESMQRLDAKILKEELGANAVRTSHYPQSHYFMDECDELGLLVFTEIPGWQHIGGDAWKDIAVNNVTDMVRQYRNHTSIILWGVRINESQDDDEFYKRTNVAAHAADPTRQTGGVRAHKNSHLFEDVYTYNDFVHSGANQGCEPKKKVTSDMEKGYLVSEYNGHMYPTKTFDDEEHRMAHAIRHANVLDAIKGQEDIAGSFTWCMFDYNTHKDFGSGDRICYHGVMDMFRNPKLAASVYASQSNRRDVLELSSSMDIGEHPACNRGDTYIFSNADSVRMYKNQILIKEYTNADSAYKNLENGPILIDDYVGDEMAKAEGYSKKQGELVKYCLNSVALHGMKITPKLVWAAVRLVVVYRMNPNSAVALYNKYVGDWGGASKQYRFDAVRDGKVVKSLVKAPMTKVVLEAEISNDVLEEHNTYDVTEIRVTARDEYHNVLPVYGEILQIDVDGPVEIIGPSQIPFRGGMTGVYLKTLGTSGEAKVTLRSQGVEPVQLTLQIKC